MTKQEIKKMEAGPEMDALVAVMVMGWVRPEKGKFWANPRAKEDSEDYYTGWFQHSVSFGGPVFRPSTEIVAAWPVVEKFRQAQQKVKIIGGEWYDGGAYQCIIYDAIGDIIAVGKDIHKHGEIEGGWNEPSAPLAICRAALLAVIGDTP